MDNGENPTKKSGPLEEKTRKAATKSKKTTPTKK